MVAPLADIEKVLADMRIAINNHKCTLVPRRINMDSLARLGILAADVLSEMYTLTSADYVSGPLVDRDAPSSDCLWVFKKSVCGNIIYIKFKVIYQINGDVIIVSFHIDNI